MEDVVDVPVADTTLPLAITNDVADVPVAEATAGTWLEPTTDVDDVPVVV